MKKILLIFLSIVLVLGSVALTYGASRENCPGNCAHIASIGIMHYDTLEEAFAAVPDGGTKPTTIMVLKDISATKAFSIPTGNKNVIIDFRNHTYTFGSGYKTGMSFGAGNTIVLKNGTIMNANGSATTTLISTKANLTLDNMTLDGDQIITGNSYWNHPEWVLLCEGGNTTVKNTDINASYSTGTNHSHKYLAITARNSGTQVTVSGSSVIYGLILAESNSSVLLEGGTFRADLLDRYNEGTPNITITGGTFAHVRSSYRFDMSKGVRMLTESWPYLSTISKWVPVEVGCSTGKYDVPNYYPSASVLVDAGNTSATTLYRGGQTITFKKAGTYSFYFSAYGDATVANTTFIGNNGLRVTKTDLDGGVQYKVEQLSLAEIVASVTDTDDTFHYYPAGKSYKVTSPITFTLLFDTSDSSFATPDNTTITVPEDLFLTKTVAADKSSATYTVTKNSLTNRISALGNFGSLNVTTSGETAVVNKEIIFTLNLKGDILTDVSANKPIITGAEGFNVVETKISESADQVTYRYTVYRPLQDLVDAMPGGGTIIMYYGPQSVRFNAPGAYRIEAVNRSYVNTGTQINHTWGEGLIGRNLGNEPRTFYVDYPLQTKINNAKNGDVIDTYYIGNGSRVTVAVDRRVSFTINYKGVTGRNEFTALDELTVKTNNPAYEVVNTTDGNRATYTIRYKSLQTLLDTTNSGGRCTVYEGNQSAVLNKTGTFTITFAETANANNITVLPGEGYFLRKTVAADGKSVTYTSYNDFQTTLSAAQAKDTITIGPGTTPVGTIDSTSSLTLYFVDPETVYNTSILSTEKSCVVAKVSSDKMSATFSFYPTLQDAMRAAKSGDVISVLSDNETATINKAGTYTIRFVEDAISAPPTIDYPDVYSVTTTTLANGIRYEVVSPITSGGGGGGGSVADAPIGVVPEGSLADPSDEFKPATDTEVKPGSDTEVTPGSDAEDNTGTETVIDAPAVSVDSNSFNAASQAVSAAIADGSAELKPSAGYTAEAIAKLQAEGKLEFAIEKTPGSNAIEMALIDEFIAEFGDIAANTKVMYFDITAVLKTADGTVVTTVSNTGKPVTISIDLNADLQQAAKDGKQICVIRAHEGEVVFLDYSMNAEKTQVSFSSADFSTYVVVAMEHDSAPADASNTGILLYGVVGLLCVIGVVVLLISKQSKKQRV